ncbi:ankyrin repeat-containing domain protein [Zopfochytrium polystomum]|nr:ankyrin repeat-containing domain protein [Zopfochytrium polystomum]
MIIKALLCLAVAASIGAAGYLSTARYLKSKEAAEIARAKAEFFAAAADRAQIEKFRQLVQKFLKQDIRDADGNSAFMIACRSGNVEGIRYILSLQSPTAITKSPLFFNTNSHGHTALHEAVLAGRADVLKVILSNTLVALALASVPAAGSRKSPLHLAVANQDEVMVDVLMRLQANVNAQDRAGVSPLMVACELGNVAISARLMQGKVDLALADANGSTALHYAIKASSPTLLEAILKRHSELRAKAASAAAISPAGKKLSDGQKSTRQRKEKPAAARRESSTGPGSSSNLSRSSSMESVASASSLTSTNTTATAGAGTVRDVLDVPNWWGFSPLLASAEQGASSCFAVLIKEGADVARTTRAGENALTLAVRSGSLDMVKTVFAEAPYLLENRARKSTFRFIQIVRCLTPFIRHWADVPP